jgi:hypothetical protein
MLVKRRTMRKVWAVLTVFVLTFAVAIAGAGAYGWQKNFWSMWIPWWR